MLKLKITYRNRVTNLFFKIQFPRKVKIHLEEWCQDYGACIAKLEGGEQLRQDLVFTEVFREGVQIVTQILEELLLLSWLFDLERKFEFHYYLLL